MNSTEALRKLNSMGLLGMRIRPDLTIDYYVTVLGGQRATSEDFVELKTKCDSYEHVLNEICRDYTYHKSNDLNTANRAEAYENSAVEVLVKCDGLNL